MNLENLESFIANLFETISQNPEQAILTFEKEWPSFTSDEREILSGLLLGVNARILENNLPLKNTLASLRILQLSEKPIVNEQFSDEYFPRLTIAEGINGNQITEVFFRLKQRGYIVGSWDDVAEAISIIFPIDQTTALKDLTEANRRKKIIPLQV